jgi:hypothetical protein
MIIKKIMTKEEINLLHQIKKDLFKQEFSFTKILKAYLILIFNIYMDNIVYL